MRFLSSWFPGALVAAGLLAACGDVVIDQAAATAGATGSSTTAGSSVTTGAGGAGTGGGAAGGGGACPVPLNHLVGTVGSLAVDAVLTSIEFQQVGATFAADLAGGGLVVIPLGTLANP